MIEPVFVQENDVRDRQLTRRKRMRRQGALLSSLLALAVAVSCLMYLYDAPTGEALPRTFVIEEGMTVADITQKAEAEGFVHSSLLLYALLSYFHDPTELFAGSYLISTKLSAGEFADKLAAKDIVIDTVAVTIPEGTRARDIGLIASKALTNFDAAAFTTLAGVHEGYLFPETYHVPAKYSEEELLKLLMTTYTEKTVPIHELLMANSLGEDGVITLASIVEREANDSESMRMVAGILQNRLREGMPLQADASMEYILDKPLSELTPADLEKDTLYNTYRYRGLPPTAIGNPGLEAIAAVLEPTKSDYFFYITDNEGVFHYARTFDEHRVNIATYLR